MSPKAKAKKESKKATKKSVEQREVRYETVTSDVCEGDAALTIDDAKELLGWEEEGTEKFGSDYLLLDLEGKKIRCTKNIGNRPFKPPLTRRWQSEILAGHWQLNGEPILIGRTEILISGQHRLVGLVLAVQEWRKDKDRWPAWKSEPVLQTVVTSGIDESDAVVNTIDTGERRDLSDVIYRSPYFADLNPSDRKRCAKYAQSTCKFFKTRVGSDLNAFCPNWSHADYLDLLDRHPRLLAAVRHVTEENGDDGKISKYLSPGYAAGFMYLMGCSTSDGSKEGDYRSAAAPEEKLLDFARWDQAQTFIVLIAGNAKELQGYRDAWAAMIEANRISSADRWALLATAWNLYVEKEDITLESLALEYDADEDGYETLSYTPTVGGIDLGDVEEIDEEELVLANGKTEDPTPEEIHVRKEKEAVGKKLPIPTLRPSKSGKSWAIDDVAWVKDPDGEHYLARLISDPWKVENSDRILVDVKTAAGKEWEVDTTDLFLMKPNDGKESVLPSKNKGEKVSTWKVGQIVWVREKGGEDWQGKIIELSKNSAKLKIQTGYQGAGNIKMVWTKILSKKQPITQSDDAV